jgi:hypothetical protein
MEGERFWYGIVVLEVRYPITHSIEIKIWLGFDANPILYIPLTDNMGGHL